MCATDTMAGLAGCFRAERTYKSVDLHRFERDILESVRHDFVGRRICTGGGRGGNVGRRWCCKAK
jgi:hypothetical protein